MGDESYSEYSNPMGDLIVKIRDIEDRQRNLKDRTFLIGQNLIEIREKTVEEMLEIKKDMEEIIGEYKLERIEEKKSILDFFKLTSYYLGKGIGSELVNNIELKNKMDIIV